MNMFNDIIGYDSIKIELKRVCDIMQNPKKYESLGVKVPNGLILHGIPGVGKTLFANCFINESKQNYFVCRKNKSAGDFVNMIKETFDKAKENAPCIILLDDLDKFANEDKDHKDAEEYITVQSCIDEIKGCNVFVFATANNIYKIPESLLRSGRFDISIEVKPPKGKDAIKIIEHYLKNKKYVDDIDVNEIARLLNGRSCAELESIINQAGIYAGFENKTKIEFNDIIRACKRSVYEAPETIKNENNKINVETAYHEIGHAIVSEILEPKSVTIISIEESNGNIGGFTGYYRDDSYWNSVELMRNRVCTLLGGKCAVELFFGKSDAGCTSDIERAVNVLRRIITEYCDIGFDKVDFGYNQSDIQKNTQEKTIANELEKCYKTAKEILIKNRNFVMELAEQLIKDKTILGKDIQKIREKYI